MRNKLYSYIIKDTIYLIQPVNESATRHHKHEIQRLKRESKLKIEKSELKVTVGEGMFFFLLYFSVNFLL